LPKKSREKIKVSEKKTAFIICPIGEEKSETRIRSDQILKYLIEPVVSEFGYTACRSDMVAELGIITSRVIEHIVDDYLVIADITDYNANVFYELALRHALRKPYVQLMQEGQKPPFDVAQTRIIFVNYQNLESVEKAKEQLKKQIQLLESNPKVDSPISIAMDVKSLKESEKPLDRILAEIKDLVSINSARLQNLDEQVRKVALEASVSEGNRTLLEARIKNLIRIYCPVKKLEEEFSDLFQSIFFDQVCEKYRDNCAIRVSIKRKDIKGVGVALVCVQAEYKIHNVTERPLSYTVPFRWSTLSFVKRGIPLEDHLRIEKILVTKDTGEQLNICKNLDDSLLRPKERPPMKVELELPSVTIEIRPYGTITVYLKYAYLAELIDGHIQRMVSLTNNLRLQVDYSEDEFFVDIGDFCLPKKVTINPGHTYEWNGWFLPNHGFIIEWKPVEESTVLQKNPP